LVIAGIVGILILALWVILAIQPYLQRENLDQVEPLVVKPEKSEPDPLDGTRWELVAFVNERKQPSLPEQVQAVIEFNEGLLSFEAGCNNVGGYYLLDEEHITMTFMAQTLVDCSDKAGVMEVEAAFVAAMETFETYQLGEGELRIRHTGGELLFRRLAD
jgi:heat shock protein HslJ